MLQEREFQMNMTKTVFRNTILQAAVLALCTTTLSTMPMMAQPAPAAQGQGGGGGGRMSPERQTEALTTALSLTPDQVTKVTAINTDSMKQMTALRDDSSLDQDARRAKMTDIRKASTDKIKAILTDEQKPKYDALLAQQAARRGGGGGAPQL
jgi:protein CpxP